MPIHPLSNDTDFKAVRQRPQALPETGKCGSRVEPLTAGSTRRSSRLLSCTAVKLLCFFAVCFPRSKRTLHYAPVMFCSVLHFFSLARGVPEHRGSKSRQEHRLPVSCTHTSGIKVSRRLQSSRVGKGSSSSVLSSHGETGDGGQALSLRSASSSSLACARELHVHALEIKKRASLASAAHRSPSAQPPAKPLPSGISKLGLSPWRW